MVKDLIAAWLAIDGVLRFEVSDVAIHDIETVRPWISYSDAGRACELQCDFVAGCDGSHGVSRSSIPAAALTTHSHAYPFAWLGILAEAAPATDELIYGAWHEPESCSGRGSVTAGGW